MFSQVPVLITKISTLFHSQSKLRGDSFGIYSHKLIILHKTIITHNRRQIGCDCFLLLMSGIVQSATKKRLFAFLFEISVSHFIH